RAPRYATFELFEEHKLACLALREFNNLGLEVFGRNRTEVVERFLRTVDVVENEMRAPASLPAGDFCDAYARFLEMLERYHVLTFNQCVARAVCELGNRPEVAVCLTARPPWQTRPRRSPCHAHFQLPSTAHFVDPAGRPTTRLVLNALA
ncbi:MAG: hypothetical protein ACKO4Q_16840, partial [Planctomycetota bacterium]